MKILHVITKSDLGGAQSVVASIANSLAQEHSVTVAAGEGDGKLWAMLSERVEKVELRHMWRAVRPLQDMLGVVELRKLYNRIKPDVVHLHSSKAGVLGRLALPRKRVVYTVHGFDSVRLAFRRFLPVERALQGACQKIAAVSHYDYKNLLKEGISRNVVTIYNGIFTPKTEGIERPKEFDPTKKSILCIARVQPPKDHKLFIEIARLMPQYNFVWIGNMEPLQEPMPSNCHFIGNLPSAGAYCQFADLFVLTSNYEGLPMTILEAMSLSKPVVSSDVGGVSEIVRSGINGYVLPNSAEEFAKHIDKILQDPQLYAKMSAQSLDIFNRELRVEIMAESYLKIYNEICR